MNARISRPLLDRILAHAASDPEREVCGLLLGSVAQVFDILETANVAADPATSFEIDPAALFAAIRAARAGGPRVIGHYHSHPNGLATPSPRDAEAATGPGRLWLIVARGEARLWREQPGGAVHGAFAAVDLVVSDAG